MNLRAESKINTKLTQQAEFEQFMESLRTRFNVLNTSMFLLEDNLKSNTGQSKTLQYINKINLELQRIRNLINQVPENYQSIK